MAGPRALAKGLLEYGTVTLEGCARACLLQGSWAGAACLCAAVLLSPWSAAGGLIGGMFFVGLGMVFGQDRKTWKSGVGSYDGVILGLLWGGVLSEGEAPALWTFFAR